MNSFCNSLKPVKNFILFIYNLSLGLYIKRKYMTLSMMKCGPRQHGNDIGVCLGPLFKYLKLLWVDGVETFDAFTSKVFMMHALLFVPLMTSQLTTIC